MATPATIGKEDRYNKKTWICWVFSPFSTMRAASPASEQGGAGWWTCPKVPKATRYFHPSTSPVPRVKPGDGPTPCSSKRGRRFKMCPYTRGISISWVRRVHGWSPSTDRLRYPKKKGVGVGRYGNLGHPPPPPPLEAYNVRTSGPGGCWGGGGGRKKSGRATPRR